MSKKCKEYRKFEMFLARMAGKACRKLHLTSPSIPSYQLAIDDEPVVRSKSNSWVRNMINIMALQGMMGAQGTAGTTFFQDGQLNFRTTAGTITAITTSSHLKALDSEPASYWTLGSAYGILVGSSDTAESFDDYALGTLIGNGSGAGQLTRSIGSLISKVWDSANRKWVATIQRSFINSSGGDVTVKELGFYAYALCQTYSSNQGGWQTGPWMLIRDVLPEAITVANGQTLTVTYTIEYSY